MNALRRMSQYLRPYRWLMFIGFFTVVLPVAMELIVPRMLQYIVDEGIRAGDMGAVWWGTAIMLGGAVVGALTTVGQGVCRAQVSQGLAYDLRNVLFQHIQGLSFANLDQMQTGQLMTRVSSDVDTVRMFFSAGVALLLRLILMLIGSVVMMLITDLRLSLIMIVVLTLSSILVWKLMQAAQPLFGKVQRKLGALNTVVQENLAGVQVVKAYVRERHEIGRFDERNVEYRDQNVEVGRLLALASPVLLVLTNVGISLVIWWGGLDVINGRLTLGELIAFNNYLMIGMGPILFLGNMLAMVSRADASAERMWAVLDTEPTIQVAAAPHKRKMQGSVVFDNVSFRYLSGRERGQQDGDIQPNGRAEKWKESIEKQSGQNGSSAAPNTQVINGSHKSAAAVNGATADVSSVQLRDRNGSVTANGAGQIDHPEMSEWLNEEVLDGVSFTVKQGQQVALLGATGSGKSTLVHLIPRFYDVTGGQILVDDVDIREWATDSLRSQIGVVLQQNTLFSGTMRENIAYGRPDATMDEVLTAAKAAQAHDFIEAMPDRYESKVEARGANLSGGQKQRIAIARALLIKPAILIMDDSTSAVDLDTEFKIQQALATLMERTTTFIVAQRINSVLDADQIIILDGGKIVATGTHRTLMESSSIYQEIYRSQFGEEVSA
ncbi:MAG: ABC transporter ATP-binding protein [Chloroflexota bacterium]